jgi:cell division protein ZipA
MDFAMREWLTVIVVLLVIGVLLDGWRRMRHSRRTSIKMSLSMHRGTDKNDLLDYGSELPNGGARVIIERDEEDAKQKTHNVKESFAKTRNPSMAPKIPEQVSLNLDELVSEEAVPMLMEPMPISDEQPSEELEICEPQEVKLKITEPDKDVATNLIASGDVVSKPRVVSRSIEPTVTEDTARHPITPSAGEKAASAPVTEEVLIINVMALDGRYFDGSLLLDQLIECGMRFGEMNIFHRHADDEGEGPVMFSMVNMVVPGTFDLNDMQNFSTPGVSLFMTLPLQCNTLKAFNCMADTAKALASHLGGVLKDENRSVMTAQTIEHSRQRIRDFERKQLSRTH